MGNEPMAFYHGKGLVPTWHLARKYIEGGGRLATLPDIIDARLATEPGAVPWETWFTTLSAEYVGIGRHGRKIIIVAHGVGPMSTLDGITAAYRHEFSDKERRRRGGRISIEEFHKLEDGHYGEVFIVDFEEYVRLYEYPFLSYLRTGDAGFDPLLYARFGGRDRTMDYILHHAIHATRWHDEQREIAPEDRYNLQGTVGPREYKSILWRRRFSHRRNRLDPFLVQVSDASNCSYEYQAIEEGTALAHLLSIGCLMHVRHDGHESLAFSAGVYEWSSSCRFVGIPTGAAMTSIHPGWKPQELMAAHWEQLMVPLSQPAQIGLRPLIQLGDNWFTHYPAQGHTMATHEPEFLVTQMEQIGDPVEFQTEIHGHHIFFRYDIKDVRAIAPPRANGFTMDDPEIVHHNGDPTHHRAMITFYRITVDTTRRLRRAQDLEGDYETQSRLIAQE